MSDIGDLLFVVCRLAHVDDFAVKRHCCSMQRLCIMCLLYGEPFQKSQLQQLSH